MSAAVIAALCTGVAGIVGAVFNGLALLRHASDPGAHNDGHDQGSAVDGRAG